MRERDKRGVAGEVERKGGKGVLNIRRGTGASTHTCSNGCTKCGTYAVCLQLESLNA